MIPTGLTKQQLTSSILPNIQIISDNAPAQFYTKQRNVASGLRFFKTSVSDTESG